jgi:wyosine [tRNA(Phe)-imidazoG37] synthetase (radical SAM superfamily)
MKRYQYLYGPVPSRRLGRSLGIDLVPRKICTYDCIYCQIGSTTKKALVRKEYVPVQEILDELECVLKEKGSSIDYLSLSGSGEPTLHSQIGLIIERVKTLTSIPVAVITNGSLLYREEVRQDLLHADIVLPSLDAVSPEVFLKINRPHPDFSIEKVIEGMVAFRKIYQGKIWLEILFCKGINDGQGELWVMKDVIDRIKPDEIHLNTVVRPPSVRWVAPLDQKQMEEIRAFFGEKASIISEFNRHPSLISERDIREEILKILERRPLSRSDLSKGMGIQENELDKYIKPLVQERRIQTRLFGDSIYYEIGEDLKE